MNRIGIILTGAAMLVLVMSFLASGLYTHHRAEAESVGAGFDHGAGDNHLNVPVYDEAFAKQWRDGRAEIAAYDLKINRYGQTRHGNAVMVFVTEPFTNEQRVKADIDHGDNFEVIKLNWIEDFPTGIYDYNLMTSAFIATSPANGLPAGSLTKSNTSSQEWCGQGYAQVVTAADKTEIDAFHYWDGHAEYNQSITAKGSLSEDALFFVARGLAYPVIERGDSQTVQMLTSTRRFALSRNLMTYTTAKLTRASGTKNITVPAGEFEVETFTAQMQQGGTWEIHVEVGGERRIIAYKHSSGIDAKMLGAKRWRYWGMSGSRYMDALKEIGMEPRKPNMP